MKKSIKVMIIDDNTDYIFTMETYLGRHGYETVATSKGETALEKVREAAPNVILLDVMMESVYSGFEICKQLRNDKQLRHIPIIAISGMEEELGVGVDLAKDYDYFRPDEFMDKPVDKELLMKKINELVANSAKRKKNPIWQKA